MIGLLCFVLAILVSPFKSKLRLEVENAVLRHQLIVLKRRLHGRVRLTNLDRWFFIQLYRWFPSILTVLTIIQPETLVHWHRASARVARMVGNSVRRKPIPWRTTVPRSSMKARIWLMMPVRCDTSRSCTRCSACRSSCSAVLVATNLIVGRCTASAIASASLKSFFCPLLYGRTYLAGINLAA